MKDEVATIIQATAPSYTVKERISTDLYMVMGMMMVIFVVGVRIGCCWTRWRLTRAAVRKVVKDTQTREVGLRASVKTRVGVRAQWAQRCQRCLETLERGEFVDNYTEGWCHEACRYGPVR